MIPSVSGFAATSSLDEGVLDASPAEGGGTARSAVTEGAPHLRNTPKAEKAPAVLYMNDWRFSLYQRGKRGYNLI